MTGEEIFKRDHRNPQTF
jgi:hypothetical protein